MADSFLGPKPVRSVAAFLWMPQIHLSVRHMSYLAPVFMRTLASVFVSAGLLPRNHPALMYGVEGVRKYGISEIIGEAWFNLRSTRADTNQWGIFIGVMLMFALVIGAFISFFMTVLFGVGATAQAQLFSNPLGDSKFNADGRYSSGGTSDPFDKTIPDAGTAAGDFGIMLLDKVVRASANDMGGPLQRGVKELMLVYNSGILVIASVIIFWMIINIVVDTAKTGQVGGGRHNMVWLPIRIIFALALLIPLGSAGYSSGQYMVIKLAEWGSNFGSKGWAAYTRSVAENTSLLAGQQARSMSDVVVMYNKMWVCRISVNAHKLNGGSTNADELITERTSDTTFLDGRRAVTFTDGSYENLCGRITYRVPGSTDIYNQLFSNSVFNEDAPIHQAVYRLTSTMENAYYQALTNTAFKERIKEVACLVVGGNSAFGGGAIPGCSTPGTGSYPTIAQKAVLEQLIKDYESSVSDTYTQAFGRFRTDMNQLADIMSVRGWPSMGLWYHRIAQLNAAAFKAANPSNIIQAGEITNLDVGEDDLGGGISRWWNGTQWVMDAREDLDAFDKWWRSVPENSVYREGDAQTPAATGQRGVGRGGANMSSGGTSNLDLIVGSMGVQDKNGWIAFLDNDDPNVYPLATLSSIGETLIWSSLGLIALVTGIQALGSIFSSVYDINNWAVWPFLVKLALLPMGAGAMLKFYVPMIPMIRVIFSILTWIISVFEAVVMVPIAALAHLSSQGEGLSGQAGEAAWKLWLNILLRPILTVLGFVGAMLVFNGFVPYINGAFMYTAGALPDTSMAMGFIQSLLTAIIYTFIIYTVANTVFKMLDLIPDALGRWYSMPRDQSFANDSDSGALTAITAMKGLGSPFGRTKPKEEKPTTPPDDKTTPSVETGGGGGAGKK